MENSQERQIFDIGWLIAIIDGEGSFMINRIPRAHDRFDYAPEVNISNTNHLITDKAQAILSFHGVSCYLQHKKNNGMNGRPYWSLQIKGLRRVKSFLDKFLPFMECRIAQASTLKEYVERRLNKPVKSPFDETDYWLIAHLRELNGRKFVSPETTRQAPEMGEDIVRTE